MRLLADVHVKQAYITALREEGHDVERVVDVAELGGTATDGEILSYAVERDVVILTNDAKDFTGAQQHAGVIIVPQTGLSPGEVAAAVSHIDQFVPDCSNTVLYATDWAT